MESKSEYIMKISQTGSKTYLLSSSSKDECLGAVQNVEELSLVTGMVVADLLAILCSILFLLATLAYFFWVEKFRTTFIFIQANVKYTQ